MHLCVAKSACGLPYGSWETDHMFLDGLEDAETGRLMAHLLQDMAKYAWLYREQMDDFAIRSLQRAQKRLLKVILRMKSFLLTVSQP